MKIFLASVVFCLFAIYTTAQLNTDTTQNKNYKRSAYDEKVSRAQDHLHPRYLNIANPGGPGYEIDGAVIRSEAIINRHVTNINELIR